MPKILIEYKGIPAIIDHSLERVDKITFIVTYKSEDNDFIRKDFLTIDEAFEFNPESELKLVFVYLELFNEDNSRLVLYKSVEFTNNKLLLNSIVQIRKGYFNIIIEYGLEAFRIKKGKNLLSPDVDIYYSRRKTIKKETKKEYQLVDSYYDLVPRYEDIFLETIFFLDIIKLHFTIIDRSELEAYFLQAKIKIEDKKNPKKLKEDKIDEQPPVSEELITLENLIGLEKIKLEIQELRALASFRQKRIEVGLPVTPTTLHMVFTGNPGTGKTTVARLLGQIYFDMGILAENKVIEATRQDLVEYVGHTAPKTQKVFEKAIGGNFVY